MDYKVALAAAIAKAVEMDEAAVCDMIEIPSDTKMGDFAMPCFKLARTLKKAPPAIAAELMEKVALPEGIERAEVAGGYLNFFTDKTLYAKNAVMRVLREGDKYGASGYGEGKNAVIEYSSVNIAKPFHIGHLSTTVIGHALARIYECAGYNVTSINHLGDWGTQFGKLIVAYKLWGERDAVERGSIRELTRLYVKYHEEAEKNPALDDEARAWFRKIEQGDGEALELFTWFKELTLREVGKIYDMLDIRFDSYAGESFYSDKMPAVIDELKQKGLLKTDDGAQIVDLSEYNMPPCIILKRDGSTLYATRDIAALLYRKATYNFDKLLYVVAYQQDLHFKQFFKVLELMGRDYISSSCFHVNYGMVSLEEGTLSTRKGNVVYLEDVLEKAVEKTLEIIKEKSPDLENKEAVARDVGIGAVVWGPLYNQRIKDITFSWDKVLNFDGETGPYAQYTHARCCSVLRKSDKIDTENIDFSKLMDEESVALIKSIAALPDCILEAVQKNEPYLVSRCVIAICQKFNKFYFDHRISDAEPDVRNARLALTKATKTAIKNGLYLIGLKAPERM